MDIAIGKIRCPASVHLGRNVYISICQVGVAHAAFSASAAGGSGQSCPFHGSQQGFSGQV